MKRLQLVAVTVAGSSLLKGKVISVCFNSTVDILRDKNKPLLGLQNQKFCELFYTTPTVTSSCQKYCKAEQRNLNTHSFDFHHLLEHIHNFIFFHVRQTF